MTDTIRYRGQTLAVHENHDLDTDPEANMPSALADSARAVAHNTPPPVRYVKPGETVTLELPWSEVCMSMRVAGRTAQVRLEPVDDRDNCVAQIFDDHGRPFSFPVLPGEAGIMRNTDGWYYYPPTTGACGWTCTDIGLG